MRRFALFVSLLLAMAGNAVARSRLDDIVAHGVLRVGLTGGLPPVLAA